MIIVLGSVTLQPEQFESALALSREHVARSRTEPGCITHAVHRDCENSLRLVFVERWSDQAALAAHFQVPASRAFAKALRDLAAEPPSMAVYEATQIRI